MRGAGLGAVLCRNLQNCIMLFLVVGRGRLTPPEHCFIECYKFVECHAIFVGGGVPDAPDGPNNDCPFVGNIAVGRPALWPPDGVCGKFFIMACTQRGSGTVTAPAGAFRRPA